MAKPDTSSAGVHSLIAEDERIRALAEEAVQLPSVDLREDQLPDLELLLGGAFTPLAGYLGREDYGSVCDSMRLSDDTLWPIPITLDLDENVVKGLSCGDRVALRHPEGMVLAILTVADVWRPDLEAEARAVIGTTDDSHPGVHILRHRTAPVYVGGALEGLELPPHHTFRELRFTPLELRARFARLGWKRVVAVDAREPMHRAELEATRQVAQSAGAQLLLQPVVGRTGPDDVDLFTRVHCYRAVLEHYPPGLAMLGLLPLATRLAGPREAVLQVLIARNHGCTHWCTNWSAGAAAEDDGESGETLELCRHLEKEIGVEIVTPSPATGPGTLSTAALRRRLHEGAEIPDDFSYPEVIDLLRRRYPARCRQGFTVFFTGLSGSGKSTIANILTAQLLEMGGRPVTLLDGDLVRKNLSSELGFSREHRDVNIRRIGFVASEITKNGGVAVCAPIAPYRRTRRDVRELIAAVGGFIEVHVATPLEVCEARDRKGLYAKARAGLIKEFTGIDDPYEVPGSPEVRIDTTVTTAEDGAREVLRFLEGEGYLAGGV